jgi:hypothetical protein
MTQQFTPEEIATQYEYAMASVNLINGPKPQDKSAEEWEDIVASHKLFLLTVLAQTFWTTEDLSPFQTAAE